MINTISGTITAIFEQAVVLDAPALGMSFMVATPRPEIFAKAPVTLFTHVHWNQEQGPSLYGFQTVAERDAFVVLLGCSGIGPKVALALLQALRPHELAQVMRVADHKTLAQVKGIGTKKAEHMIVHLKDKLDQFYGTTGESSPTVPPAVLAQVAEVLYSLNYSRQEVQHALAYVREQTVETPASFDVLMRTTLAFLSKRP